jgi:hypothetical protein
MLVTVRGKPEPTTVTISDVLHDPGGVGAGGMVVPRTAALSVCVVESYNVRLELLAPLPT